MYVHVTSTIFISCYIYSVKLFVIFLQYGSCGVQRFSSQGKFVKGNCWPVNATGSQTIWQWMHTISMLVMSVVWCLYLVLISPCLYNGGINLTSMCLLLFTLSLSKDHTLFTFRGIDYLVIRIRINNVNRFMFIATREGKLNVYSTVSAVGYSGKSKT